MPWTFSHPAAILPLRRYCPVPLDFSALVIGSMIPDLGYYLSYSSLARSAHSFPGSALVCLPAGLAFWAIFHLLRKPLCFVLPQPHRGALAALAATPFSIRPRILIATGISILLGAWTHIVWDSFTHNTWLVKELPLLRESVFRLGTVEFPLYALLQHLSTVVGAGILIVAYFSWLRLHRPSITSASAGADDGWRYLLLAAVAVLAFVIAVPRAFDAASNFEGYLTLRVLVFRTVVDTTVAFFALFTLSSLVLYATKRESQGAR
ncbi:MAG TPA: DUF4184 family protein [Candidatus Binatia bacterium]|nr:DUF4184 family protein [Candidatus Binatia bacterium]